MRDDQARERIELCERVLVRPMFKRTGSMEPMFQIVGADGRHNILLPTAVGITDKDMAAGIVRELCREVKAAWVLYVSEAWTLEAHANEVDVAKIARDGLRDDPRRQEVVVYTLESRDAGFVTAHQPIVRPPGARPYLGGLAFDKGWKESEGRFGLPTCPKRGAPAWKLISASRRLMIVKAVCKTCTGTWEISEAHFRAIQSEIS